MSIIRRLLFIAVLTLCGLAAVHPTPVHAGFAGPGPLQSHWR